MEEVNRKQRRVLQLTAILQAGQPGILKDKVLFMKFGMNGLIVKIKVRMTSIRQRPMLNW
ncbi:hypothetical protein CF037_26435 [Klebsiella pneumoniae]|nr:hypothetical protein [Klebsiella pneumoniae]